MSSSDISYWIAYLTGDKHIFEESFSRSINIDALKKELAERLLR